MAEQTNEPKGSRRQPLGLLRVLAGGISLTTALGCGRQDAVRVSLAGDPMAVGARVFVDEAPAGTMSADPATAGPVLRDSATKYSFARCAEVGDTIVRAGEMEARGELMTTVGPHRLRVVSVRGDTLLGGFYATSSAIIDVSFRCKFVEQLSQ